MLCLERKKREREKNVLYSLHRVRKYLVHSIQFLLLRELTRSHRCFSRCLTVQLPHCNSKCGVTDAGRNMSADGADEQACTACQRLERSRLQIHSEFGRTENMSILVVNFLAVSRPLPFYIVSNSVVHPLDSIKQCRIHST